MDIKLLSSTVVMGVVCYFSNLDYYSPIWPRIVLFLILEHLLLAVIINQIIYIVYDFFVKSSNNR